MATDGKPGWLRRLFNLAGNKRDPSMAAGASIGSRMEVSEAVEQNDAGGESAQSEADVGHAAQEAVPAVWNVGDVILDLYEVKEVFEGGMGTVCRVHHRDREMEVAVKCPRPDYFKSQLQKESFVRECLAWIGLGLHPHVVTCHYVRTLGDIPRAFAEYVEGGSLRDWIRNRRLYEGGHEEALKRILDIAIQFAWGLHFAHEKGLIHQDVKPANVLLTSAGTAKVADFGLAHARASAGEGLTADAEHSILASCGGMTPAYCSPEQADKKKLTRRTDIWSWAVSVFEMFSGEVTWGAGQIVDSALAAYQDTGPAFAETPRMPTALVELLKHCLRQDPGERPHDFAEVVSSLLDSYKAVTDEKYSRPEPKPVSGLPDTLNNEGISLSELGLKDEAEERFKVALKMDPHHPEATYNLGLLQWRAGRLTIESLLIQLREISETGERIARCRYLLGLLHLEFGRTAVAVEQLDQANSHSGDDASIRRALFDAQSKCSRSAGLIRTFAGHSDRVYSLSISSDGRRALSGSADKTLRLWDLDKSTCLLTLKGHADTVRSVTISPDNHFGLSASEDETVRLWELNTGKCVRTLIGHESRVVSVAISPDGRFGLSGSEDSTLRLWDLGTGQCVRTFDCDKDPVSSATISPDGRWVLSTSWNHLLRLWNLSTGKCIRSVRLPKFMGEISVALAICPDSRFALVEDINHTLLLFELCTGKRVRSLVGHTRDVLSVAISADGKWAISAGTDEDMKSEVRLWEIGTGRCVRTFEGCTEGVCPVAISPDQRWWLSGGVDEAVRMWEFTAGPAQDYVEARLYSAEEVSFQFRRFSDSLRTAKQSLDCKRIEKALSASRSSREVPSFERSTRALDVWRSIGDHCLSTELRGAWRVQSLVGHTQQVLSVAISCDGRWGLSGSWDGTLRLWELATGICIRELRGHSEAVCSVAISTDGRLALSGSSDCALRFWDLSTGGCLRTFERHSGSVRSLTFSPDVRWGLSGGGTTLRLWDLTTGMCIREMRGHSEAVCSVAISPDGCWAVSGGGDGPSGELRLWDLTSGKCIRTFKGHTETVSSVATSPDGRWVLSGSHDRTLRLWELSTGKCVRTIEGQTQVSSVGVSSDGHWGLAGGGFADSANLWIFDIASGKCLRTFEGHTHKVEAVAISNDKRWVLSGSADRTLQLWELDWDYDFPGWTDWDERARPHLADFLTLHTPYASELPPDREPTEEEVVLALTRRGKPSWNHQDWLSLLASLGRAGFGWLRPESVGRELEKMAAKR